MTILIASVLISLINAYKLVDLPLPVGPLVNTIPFGRLMPLRIVRSERPAYPICSRSNKFPALSSRRITTCSPHTTGLIAMRRSTSLSLTRTVNCPSCGIRCSSIFKLDKIFIRLTSAGSILFGSCITSRSTPSIRQRIFSDFSSGSI